MEFLKESKISKTFVILFAIEFSRQLFMNQDNCSHECLSAYEELRKNPEKRTKILKPEKIIDAE